MKGEFMKRPWRRIGTTLCLLCLVVSVFAACGGKKEVKQQSPESKTSQEAFALAEVLRSAYVKKDFTAAQDVSTPGGYKEFVNSIRHFDSVDLAFTPRWVQIEKGQVHLNVSWRGTWNVGSEIVRERGMAVFLLEGKPLRLGRIMSGNPFKHPER